MFDDSLETCWNSDQGTPQYILLDFAEKVEVTRFSIQFQGGFAGSSWYIQYNNTIIAIIYFDIFIIY